MKIAVLGAGFAGLSLVWHLLEKNQHIEITLFDAEEIGGGASGLSSGLLNPYGGLHAKKTWSADLGVKEAKRLMKLVEIESQEPLLFTQGILRPACVDSQILDFKFAAQKFPELEWWSKSQCLENIPLLNLPLEESGGLFIPEGLTLYVKRYLKGLWKLCKSKGAIFIKKKIDSIEELHSFDRVVCALGAGSQKFFKEKSPPLSIVKGQLLIFEWLKSFPKIPYSLVSQGYLVLSDDQKTCMAGATFEREYATLDVNLEVAKRGILPKIASFFPAIYDLPLLDCKAGARLNYKSHLPIVDKISEKIWIFTAMGSKGLIYHAWAGKLLADAIILNNTSPLPKEFLLR